MLPSPSAARGAAEVIPLPTGWLPPPADQATERPAPARVTHDLLGGLAGFEVDRRLAQRLVQAVPDAAGITWTAREFLRRAVRSLLFTGVDQIIDLGCGILGDGSSLHDLILPAAPTVRVVHVDLDSIVAEYAADLIARTGRRGWAAAFQTDIAQPRTVLDHPDTARLLDLGRPVAIIAADVLQHLADPARVLAEYRDAVVAGSHLVISHPCGDARPQDMQTLTDITQQAGIPTRLRSRTQVAGLFDGFTLLPPGLIWAERWRPTDDEPGHYRGQRCVQAGVGLKPLIRLGKPARTRRGPTPAITNRREPRGHQGHDPAAAFAATLRNT